MMRMVDMKTQSPSATVKPEKEKRFECSHCQRRFARLEHLQRHERIHSGVKPFRCKECNYSFTRSDLLVRHERLTHNKAWTSVKASPPSASDIYGSATEPPPARPSKRIRNSFDSNNNKNTDSNPLINHVSIVHSDIPQRTLPSLPASTPASSMSTVELPNPSNQQPVYSTNSPSPVSRKNEYSLAALSAAAEYQALHGTILNKASGPLALTNYDNPLLGSTHVPNREGRREEVQKVQEDPTTRTVTSSSSRQDSQGIKDQLDNLTFFINEPLLSTDDFSSIIVQGPLLRKPSSNEDTTINDFFPRFSAAGSPRTKMNFPVRHPPSHHSHRPASAPPLHPKRSKQHPPIFNEFSSWSAPVLRNQLSEFETDMPPGFTFRAPSQMALVRYYRAYMEHFHPTMSFVHIPSLTLSSSLLELYLAIAAIGAYYCSESVRAAELFETSLAIVKIRMRRRDESHGDGLDGDKDRDSDDGLWNCEEPRSRTASTTAPAPYISSGWMTFGPSTGAPPSDPENLLATQGDPDDMTPTIQSLLLLSSLTTLSKQKEITREAPAIQSLLLTLTRESGFCLPPIPNPSASHVDPSACQWPLRESTKRTKFAVYILSNLQSIVFNIPPLILSSELRMGLPCQNQEFNHQVGEKSNRQDPPCYASDSANQEPEIGFQEAFEGLFGKEGREIVGRVSGFARYVLAHAVLQHIFLLRQIPVLAGKGEVGRDTRKGDKECGGEGYGLGVKDVRGIEVALENLGAGLYAGSSSSSSSCSSSSPKEGSLNQDPMTKATASLIQLAYIRLYTPTSPRFLESRDPVRIAEALRGGPRIQRNGKVMKLVLQAVHSLAVAVKTGYRVVGRMMGLRGVRCGVEVGVGLGLLEGGVVLVRWLEAVGRGWERQSEQNVTNGTKNAEEDEGKDVTETEKRILGILRMLLGETEFGVPTTERDEGGIKLVDEGVGDLKAETRELAIGVLRLWSFIFRGVRSWVVVEGFGRALGGWAEALEAG